MSLLNNQIFACGTERDHVCDDKGAVLILDDNSTVKDTLENREIYKERERGWSVACSVCSTSQFHVDIYG